MDAALAGILVQATMEHFWNTVKTQAALKSMSEEKLQVQVKLSVDSAFTGNKWKVQYIAPATVALEKTRISAVVNSWLEKEEQRTLPFTVIGNEVPATIKVGHKEYKLSIDRIEEIEVGGHKKLVYLDHKTGSMINALGMMPNNMTNPQLPIYTQAVVKDIDRSPDGIALAQVRAGEMRFYPLASFDTGLAKPSKVPATDENWGHNLSNWGENVDSLYCEFLQGEISRHGAVAKFDEYLNVLLK